MNKKLDEHINKKEKKMTKQRKESVKTWLIAILVGTILTFAAYSAGVAHGIGNEKQRLESVKSEVEALTATIQPKEPSK